MVGFLPEHLRNSRSTRQRLTRLPKRHLRLAIRSSRPRLGHKPISRIQRRRQGRRDRAVITLETMQAHRRHILRRWKALVACQRGLMRASNRIEMITPWVDEAANVPRLSAIPSATLQGRLACLTRNRSVVAVSAFGSEYFRPLFVMITIWCSDWRYSIMWECWSRMRLLREAWASVDGL